MFHPQGPTLLDLAVQALSSTDRGYDLLAPRFDVTPFRTPDDLLAVVASHLQSGPPIQRAVDLCCGTGAGIRMLRPLVQECVVGMDRSEGMLKQAHEQSQMMPGHAPVHLVRADVLDPPFRGQFDVATCFGAFGHIQTQDEPQFVESVFQILRPGGRFVFISSEMPSRLSRGYWLARGFNGVMRVRNALLRPPFIMYYLTFMLPEVEALLARAGFRVHITGAAFPGPWRLVEAWRDR